MRSYIHKEIEEEIKTISGYLIYLEELQLNFRGRTLLCVVGVGVVDNSCCGVGGCRSIEVPGYVVSWKSSTDDAGNLTSDIEPIKSEEEKKEIEAELNQLYPHSQISFG
jgi:hypothetical protein